MTIHEANEDPGVMGRFYARILAWSFKSTWHRMGVMGIAVVVLLLSGLVASGLKFSFFPEQDSGEYTVGFELPPGSTLAETDRLARQAEAILHEDQSIEIVPEHGRRHRQLRARLVRGQAARGLRDQGVTGSSARAAELPAAAGLWRCRLWRPGWHRCHRPKPLQISVQSNRPLNDLIPLLQQFQTQTEGIAGLADIDTTFKPGAPELQFHVDPAKIGNLGVTNDDIATSVRALISGDRATAFREGRRRCGCGCAPEARRPRWRR